MNGTGVFTLSNRVLAGSLALLMFGALAGQAGKTQSQAGKSNAAQPAQRELAQQAIPDAPKPQTKLPNLGSIAPGQGTTSTSAGHRARRRNPRHASGRPRSCSGHCLRAIRKRPAAHRGPGPAYQPPPGEGVKAMTLMVQVNYVDLPFTVKDKNLLFPDCSNATCRSSRTGCASTSPSSPPIRFLSSVALIVDQSMTYDNMLRVNASLGVLQERLPGSTRLRSSPTTTGPSWSPTSPGAQSARLTQAIEISRARGATRCWPER